MSLQVLVSLPNQGRVADGCAAASRARGELFLHLGQFALCLEDKGARRLRAPLNVH